MQSSMRAELVNSLTASTLVVGLGQSLIANFAFRTFCMIRIRCSTLMVVRTYEKSCFMVDYLRKNVNVIALACLCRQWSAGATASCRVN